MASCMECIHFNPCNMHGNIIVEKPTEGNDWGLHNEVEKECKYFTPTADVVEVVRCGKCKHWSCHGKGKLIDEKIGMCYNNEFPFHCEDRPIMRATDFCSYGERRDT